jgi:branched-chain amino acid transport system permease protein
MRRRHVPVALALVAGAVVYGPLVSSYWQHVAIVSIIYAILAASWALLAGYAGQFSFGHLGFASLGGYTSALLVQWYALPIPLGMLCGLVVCAGVGGAVGWICLRMRGPYLAIFTLAFSEILRIVFLTENEVTNGAAGLRVVHLLRTPATLPYYYFGLGLLALCLAVMGLMVHSRWGLFFRAIREDEQAAGAAGVHVVRFKVLAFAVASSFAGLAGALYAHYIGILTPELGSPDQMGLVVAMAVIGGLESLPAAVGGAIGVETLQEALRSYGEWRFVLFGALLLLTMRFFRNGLLAPAWQRLLQSGGPAPVPAAGREARQEGHRA